MFPVLDVNLDLAPQERWSFLQPQAPRIRAMFAEYLADLAPVAEAVSVLLNGHRGLLEPDEWGELEGLAETLEMSLQDVLLGNLYYDALKHLWGCTAFAVDGPGGPLHGRNLDWFSQDGALATSSVRFRFLRQGREAYSTVGWPGFVGCLSGFAPGCFAVTLNSVWSDDPAELLTPMGFLLRRALERGCPYDEAVQLLAETPVASDSLLLVTGAQAGEMVVIERTPRRQALRGPENGVLVVTNDYRALDGAAQREESNELLATSCRRFDSAADQAKGGPPRSLEEAMLILAHPDVRMDITVQHMAFQAATGACLTQIPAAPA